MAVTRYRRFAVNKVADSWRDLTADWSASPAQTAATDQVRAVLTEWLRDGHGIDLSDRESAETVLRVAHGLLVAAKGLQEMAEEQGMGGWGSFDRATVTAVLLLGDACRRSLEW